MKSISLARERERVYVVFDYMVEIRLYRLHGQKKTTVFDYMDKESIVFISSVYVVIS